MRKQLFRDVNGVIQDQAHFTTDFRTWLELTEKEEIDFRRDVLSDGLISSVTVKGVGTDTAIITGALDTTGTNTSAVANKLVDTGATFQKSASTNTSISTTKLIDSTATFITDGTKYLDLVHNITDDTWAKVISVDSETQLTIDQDIFLVQPKTYIVYVQAIRPGMYVENATDSTWSTVSYVEDDDTIVLADDIFTASAKTYNIYEAISFYQNCERVEMFGDTHQYLNNNSYYVYAESAESEVDTDYPADGFVDPADKIHRRSDYIQSMTWEDTTGALTGKVLFAKITVVSGSISAVDTNVRQHAFIRAKAVLLLDETVDGGVSANDPVYHDGTSLKKATNTTATPVGIYDGTKVIESGEAYLSGLTPATAYYLGVNGGLSTDNFTGVYIGHSINTIELIVNIQHKPITQYAEIVDEKSSGTDGGSASATSWHTRDLNQSNSNITGFSLSSNQFTLPVGTYRIKYRSPTHRAGVFKSALYNVTDAVYSHYGDAARTAINDNTMAHSLGDTIITITASKAFEIRTYTGNTQSTDGLGIGTSDGSVEKYTMVYCEKIII